MRISRKFEFDAGHRVLGHDGKCAHLHGHRYVAVVTVEAEMLNSLGMVIDFSFVKEKIGRWIDENWDHNMILHRDDPLEALTRHPFVVIQNGVAQNGNRTITCKDVLAGKKPFLMAIGNPTAENMAKELYVRSATMLAGTGVYVKKVRIYETPNCWADCVREDLE